MKGTKTYLDFSLPFLFLYYGHFQFFMQNALMQRIMKLPSQTSCNTMLGIIKTKLIFHIILAETILKYKVEGKTIKFPNPHFFFQFCFVELEKRSSDPFIYTPSMSPALWPRNKEERGRLWATLRPN